MSCVTLWIDCEFNSFKGELISMALVSEEGKTFYEVIDFGDKTIHPWVEKNVIPHLFAAPFETKKAISFERFQMELSDFLCSFPQREIKVVADWPEDLQHFCESLISGPGRRITTPKMSMKFDGGIDAESEVPHNAYYDAFANMCQSLERELISDIVDLGDD